MTPIQMSLARTFRQKRIPIMQVIKCLNDAINLGLFTPHLDTYTGTCA